MCNGGYFNQPGMAQSQFQLSLVNLAASPAPKLSWLLSVHQVLQCSPTRKCSFVTPKMLSSAAVLPGLLPTLAILLFRGSCGLAWEFSRFLYKAQGPTCAGRCSSFV